MKRPGAPVRHVLKKVAISLLLLLAFVFLAGWDPFRLDLRMVRDLEWDIAGLSERGVYKLGALFLSIVVLLGMAGWSVILGRTFLASLTPESRTLPAFALSIAAFSMFSFGSSVNGILYGPWVLLFLLTGVPSGWELFRGRGGEIRGFIGRIGWILAVPLVLWLLEYLSSPLAWDAILDHSRFAREVARTHQLPLMWADHTGDMPKFTDIVMAALQSLGGESLVRMGNVLSLVLVVLSLRHLLRGTKAAVPSLAILLSCGAFLFIFTFGYVEGFLASFGLAALVCLYESLRGGRPAVLWFHLSAFLSGCALGVKYTALFIAVGLMFVWLMPPKGSQRPRPSLAALLLFLLPVLPWLLKNYLAHGNPFYPILTSLFGSAPGGYDPGMEKLLWADTGRSAVLSFPGILRAIGNAFFTPHNQVGAMFTPLVLMALPWGWKVWRDPRGRILALFATGSLVTWVFFATSLRHAAVPGLALIVLAGLAWSLAIKERGRAAHLVFAMGWAVSLWLAFAAQLRSDAPYASAMGLESRDARLARHYYFDRDVFVAYRAIEKDMRPGDRVLAHGVFQAYPLRAPVYVDFKWKTPNLDRWAGEAGTADRLARVLRAKGIRYILYQREEAGRGIRVAPRSERILSPREQHHFWRRHVETLRALDNTIVFRLRDRPSENDLPVIDHPGAIWETPFRWSRKAVALWEQGDVRGAMGAVERSRSLGLDNPELTAIMASCLARVGRGEEAQTMGTQAGRMQGARLSEIRLAMDDR